MGKKKITQQTQEEVLKEKETMETAMVKTGKAVAKKFETGRVYVHASYNNTVVSVTDDNGNLIAWSSAGALGFSGPKKSTPFAASKVVAALAEKLRKSGPPNVRVFVNGIGSGRDSAIRTLSNQGFNLLSIKDVTSIPHNGPRPPKVRRV